MDARRTSTQSVDVSLSFDEAVVLHEALAYAEWSGELDETSFRDPLFFDVLSGLQLALAPLIDELGTKRYGALVEACLEGLRPPAP